MGIEVGTKFNTGNSTVAELPVGTVLQVVGQGQLQVGVVPTNEFANQPEEPVTGDIIYVRNKDREGQVVRAGMNLGVTVGADEVLYVSDATGEPVVRRAKKSDIEVV